MLPDFYTGACPENWFCLSAEQVFQPPRFEGRMSKSDFSAVALKGWGGQAGQRAAAIGVQTKRSKLRLNIAINASVSNGNFTGGAAGA